MFKSKSNSKINTSLYKRSYTVIFYMANHHLIRVSKDTKDKLESMKIIDQEPIGSVVDRLLGIK